MVDEENTYLNERGKVSFQDKIKKKIQSGKERGVLKRQTLLAVYPTSFFPENSMLSDYITVVIFTWQ